MSLLARDVMTTTVLSVPPTLPLTELEDALIARHVGGVPVVEHGHLIGIVSRSDVVRYFTIQRSLARAFGLAHPEEAGWKTEAHLTVRDVMVQNPVTVGPTASIEAVAQAMVTHHVHRILVVEDDHVIGLISALDLAGLVADGRLVLSLPRA